MKEIPTQHFNIGIIRDILLYDIYVDTEYIFDQLDNNEDDKHHRIRMSFLDLAHETSRNKTHKYWNKT